MNRIDQTFQKLRATRRKAFIAFITAGDPNLSATEKLVPAFEKAGVDIIELGVPFSDPMADGPTIQASSQRALKKNVNLPKILLSVKRIRKVSQVPICLMTYFNPVFHYGEEKFVRDCVKAGVDGLIVPDLPPEEAKKLIRASRQHGLATIFFLSPTTRTGRIAKIAKASAGFIYYVSLTGVTGARAQVPQSYRDQVKRARKYTKTPICVGFGISTPAQVKKISKTADGVIVGSAIVNEINRYAGKKNLVPKVAKFVRRLTLRNV